MLLGEIYARLFYCHVQFNDMHQSKHADELVELYRSGDQAAAAELFQRYWKRLCGLAEAYMAPRLKRRVGADDVVQSVFQSFFRRTEQGEYAIDDSGALWNLLATITLNKLRKNGEYHTAGKRNIAAEAGADAADCYLDVIVAEPSPEHAAILADELHAALGGLPERDQEIVQLCLDGYSTPDIATKVNCSRHTARRVLNHVGTRLHDRIEQDLKE